MTISTAKASVDWSARNFRITSQSSIPLWPFLILLGGYSSFELFRFALRRRAWMVDTYRATSSCQRQLLTSGTLLAVTVVIYLIQLPAPIVLYNGFNPPIGEMGLDRYLDWDQPTILQTCRSIQTGGFAPGTIVISVDPEDADVKLPSLGKHNLVAFGNDALELRSGTVANSPQAGSPDWVARTVTAPPVRRFSLPLWIGFLAFGCWFGYLIIVPSKIYRHRRESGLCLRCGYDLRGSADRCPECGQSALDDDEEPSRRETKKSAPSA